MVDMRLFPGHDKECQGTSRGSGQLCWTPESGGSLEAAGSQAQVCHHEGAGAGAGDTLRKGTSVPNVREPSPLLGDLKEADTVSCSSENSKSHKRGGFFTSFGMKSKHRSDNSHHTRPKMKSLRQTLSSLFTPKSRGDGCSGSGQESGPSRKETFGMFKFSAAARNKSKTSAPCQRALPPVPPPRDADSEDHEGDAESRLHEPGLESGSDLTPHHSPSQPAPRPDPDADNMDFAASIERVKDVSDRMMRNNLHSL